MQPPEPGLYPNVSFADYQSWDAVNSTSLKSLAISPRHYQAVKDGEVEFSDTGAKRLGRAIHCAVLEPEQLPNRFVAAGYCSALLKSGDRKGQACCANASYRFAGEWFCGKHGPGPDVETHEIISAFDMASAEACAEALRSHPVRELFAAKGDNELSFVFDWDGLRCKGRADRLLTNDGVLVDLKKVAAGECYIEKLRRDIAKWSYHRQMAFYQYGLQQLTDRDVRCYWLFIEDGPPFDIAVVEATERDLQIGREECETLLAKLKRCRETNTWPGISQHADGEVLIHSGGLPAYYNANVFEEIEA